MSTDPRIPVAFAQLCFASVSMTLGNKWLMSQPELRPHTSLLVMFQNSVAVLVMATLVLLGAVQVSPVSRRQAAFFTWDALVLAVQTWTSLRALVHLSVSANTVCRVLAIPTIAWLEGLVLGTRLAFSRHLCGWTVVAGALLYAREDLSRDAGTGAGYFWAAANLAAYCSNSILDRLFMSQAQQTASGLAMLTQLLSIPISLAHIVLSDPSATPLATTVALSHNLDTRTLLVLLATSALAALLGRCFARCYMLASATAVTIAGNVNKAVAILLSVLLFDATMTLPQLAGLMVSLGGALAFSLLGQRSTEKQN